MPEGQTTAVFHIEIEKLKEAKKEKLKKSFHL